ncbi:hypothetical protein, partial [Limnospira sp. PMC 1252.20]|uniref:hypothetical protein n=1 Tax=Limnospira sp. PMC 1252.20 TaxID=2981050 RepID=UPI0028E17DC1
MDDGSPVLIKSPTENYPSRTTVESFKREFEIGSSLESDYFPKYLEFLEVETSCKVVINYEGSSVLSQILPLGQS